MINEENLEKMYEGFLINPILRTKTLNAYGFYSKDLMDLMERGMIERVKWGNYSLLSAERLYAYGKKQQQLKNDEKALLCFLKCYELNPQYPEVCYQLFFIYLQKKEYKKAFEYLEHLYHMEPKENDCDLNFYFYLFSIITEVPEQYRQFVKFINFSDVKVTSGEENETLKNNIRISTLGQRFALAYQQLIELKEVQEFTVLEKITQELLVQANEKQLEEKQKMISFIMQDQYQDLIDFLEALAYQHPLRVFDQYILTLAQVLVQMIKGRKPEIKIYNTDDLFVAIDGNNYALALILSEKHLKGGNAYDNVLHLLLLQINKVLKGHKVTVNQETIEEPELEVHIEDIIQTLQQQNIENGILLLHRYLKKCEKVEYEFLLVDIIKMSYQKPTNQFSDVFTLLTQIKLGQFQFHIAEYIQKFYEALILQDIEQAEIYLDILSNSWKSGQPCMIVDHLEQLLMAETKKLSFAKMNASLTENHNEYEEDINFDDSYDEPENQNSESTALYRLIEQKLEEVEDKTIVLLEPMTKAQNEEIKNIVSKISDVAFFTIRVDSLEQVVFRKRTQEKHINIGTHAKEVGIAYKVKDYHLCIEKGLELLTVCYVEKAWLYAKIGLSYMKISEYERAIDFLTIAAHLSKVEGNLYDDYMPLARRLKLKVEREKGKQKLKK